MEQPTGDESDRNKAERLGFMLSQLRDDLGELVSGLETGASSRKWNTRTRGEAMNGNGGVCVCSCPMKAPRLPFLEWSLDKIPACRIKIRAPFRVVGGMTKVTLIP